MMPQKLNQLVPSTSGGGGRGTASSQHEAWVPLTVTAARPNDTKKQHSLRRGTSRSQHARSRRHPPRCRLTASTVCYRRQPVFVLGAGSAATAPTDRDQVAE